MVVKMGLHIVCSRVHVLWSSKRFIKGELQWTSKYFQTTHGERQRNMVRNTMLDYLPYTGCCYEWNSLELVAQPQPLTRIIGYTLVLLVVQKDFVF